MTDRERWLRAQVVLDEVFETEPAARQALIERLCAGDQPLRREVDSLLAADAAAGRFLEDDALALAASLVETEPGVTEPDRTGDFVGPYRIVRELGRGGMGAVYLAERADGAFEQQVALKLVRATGATWEAARFLAERQILARLDHPNIARLLDGGTTASGQPWFAMEYVDGAPLTSWCDERRLGIAERLRLFEEVVDAVQFAHQNLVVHRDLKPSNVLVGPDGRPRLLDFGIAKLLHDEAGDDVTRTGVWLMTPEYGAPEQVRGETVTTATDVYALGAVLYELLTGHRAHTIERYTPREIERAVCETDASPPSIAAVRVGERRQRDGHVDRIHPERVADARATTPDRLRRGLAGDLDALVLTALQKDPARRYPSAEALLDDLRRFRRGQTLRARPDTAGYRLRKFVRRRRYAVAAATALFLAVAGGVGATAWQASVASKEADRARAVTDFLVGIFRVSDPSESRGRDVPASELLARGVASLESSLSAQPELRADLYGVLGEIHRELGFTQRADTLLRQSVSLAQSVWGRRDPRTATRLNALGSVLKANAQFAMAESVLVEALQIRRARLGTEAAEVGATLSELAGVYHGLGQDSLAEATYLEAIRVGSLRDGPRSLSVANDLDNLGAMWDDLGAYARADSVIRLALAIRLEALDSAHPSVLTSLHNLGAVKSSLGDYAEAERIKRIVLDYRRGLHPAGHPDVAYALQSLGSTLEEWGRFAGADSAYREALAMRRRFLGDRHNLTVGTLNNLSTLSYRMGRPADAAELMREVLATWEDELGPDHPNTLTAANNLGVMLRDAGRYDEAEPLLVRALEGRRGHLGDRNAAVAGSFRNLGILYHRTRRPVQAEKALREAVAGLREVFPEPHPRTAESLVSLADLLLETGKTAEAESLYAEAVAIRAAVFGDEDARTAEARRGLERARGRREP